MKHLGRTIIGLFCTCTLLIETTDSYRLKSSVHRQSQPLRILRRTADGRHVTLEAFTVTGGDFSGGWQVWATAGRVSLVRSPRGGHVFWPTTGKADDSKLGFSAALLLGSVGDARTLARAAGASECQFVRLPVKEIACAARVRLPDGSELLAHGSADAGELQAPDGAAAVIVDFVGNDADGASNTWSLEAMRRLEEFGELTCRLRFDWRAPFQYSRVRLRASEAANLTELWNPQRCEPRLPSAGSAAAVDLLAVYNLRSEWRAENLVASRRYKMYARGRAKLTPEGAALPGYSWLEIDTEGGTLTEHMKYDKQWSVFFMFKRSSPGKQLNSRAALFSVHRAGNPLACSVLAWTSGPGQASVYSRVHNLAAGYAEGQTMGGRPGLDSSPEAWNRVGLAYDSGGAISAWINGVTVVPGDRVRFPSYASTAPDGLRTGLSVGLVRGPEQAMLGAFRCFGVARGSLRADEFQGLFDKYCQ